MARDGVRADLGELDGAAQRRERRIARRGGQERLDLHRRRPRQTELLDLGRRLTFDSGHRTAGRVEEILDRREELGVDTHRDERDAPHRGPTDRVPVVRHDRERVELETRDVRQRHLRQTVLERRDAAVRSAHRRVETRARVLRRAVEQQHRATRVDPTRRARQLVRRRTLVARQGGQGSGVGKTDARDS